MNLYFFIFVLYYLYFKLWFGVYLGFSGRGLNILGMIRGFGVGGGELLDVFKVFEILKSV